MTNLAGGRAQTQHKGVAVRAARVAVIEVLHDDRLLAGLPAGQEDDHLARLQIGVEGVTNESSRSTIVPARATSSPPWLGSLASATQRRPRGPVSSRPALLTLRNFTIFAAAQEGWLQHRKRPNTEAGSGKVAALDCVPGRMARECLPTGAIHCPRSTTPMPFPCASGMRKGLHRCIVESGNFTIPRSPAKVAALVAPPACRPRAGGQLDTASVPSPPDPLPFAPAASLARFVMDHTN